MSGPEKAAELKRKYSGYDIERGFPGRYIVRDAYGHDGYSTPNMLGVKITYFAVEIINMGFRAWRTDPQMTVDDAMGRIRPSRVRAARARG